MKQSLALLTFLALPACAGGDGSNALVTSTTRSGDTTVVTTTIRDSVPTLALAAELSIGSDAIDRPDGLSEIYSLSVDANGRIAVYDHGRRAILVFDSTGSFVMQVGREGEGPGEYGRLWERNLTFLSDGGLATWETMSSRASTFDPQGRHVATWHVTDRMGGVTTIHPAPDGRVAIRAPIEREGESVFGREGTVLFSATGQEFSRTLLPVPGPVDWLTAGRIGEVRSVVPFGRRNVTVLFPDGSHASGNSASFRFVVAGGEKLPRVVEVVSPAVPVAAGERQYWTTEMANYFAQFGPDWKWNSAPIPDTKGYFTSALAGDDGSLLVLVAQPGSEIENPDRDRPVRPGSPPRPATVWIEPRVWYHFDSTGALTGSLSLGREIVPHHLRGSSLWAVVSDSVTGLPTVVRYRLGQ